jgi:hypothetical protein
MKKLIVEGWEEEMHFLRGDKEFLNHPALWQTKPLTDRSKYISYDRQERSFKDI